MPAAGAYRREELRRWRFRGTSTRAERWGREITPLIDAGLRAAPAPGVAFRLSWSSGAMGAVELEASGTPSIRWIQAAVVPTFPAASWVSVDGGARSDPPLRAVARARYSLDRPFRECRDDGSARWSDSVLAAMFSLPRGIEVGWEVRSADGPPPRDAPPALLPVPPGTRSLPVPRSNLELDDRRARRLRELRWRLRGTLRSVDHDAAVWVERLIRSASTEDGGNGIDWRAPGRVLGRTPTDIPITTAELVALFPAPRTRVPHSSTPPGSAPGLPLGRSFGGGVCVVPVAADEGRHALIVGETGMGKTSALLSAAVRASALGGVVLFDPVGDTSRRLLDRLPPSSLARVDWVSPTVSPIGVNALRGASAVGPAGERALHDLVQALRRVRSGRYEESAFWGPRVEEMVYFALRAAARFPSGTLATAVELLVGAAGRLGPVPPEATDAVRDLVERVRDRPDELDGARRALDEVVRSPTLVRMLASAGSSYSVAERVRAGAIVLVSGEAPETGEASARLLLSVHLAMLWNGLLAPGSRRKVFVLADELGWYANDAAVQMWRLARRLNVHLWAATQSLAALPEAVRESAVTNSADVLVFRGSPDDAKLFSRWAPVGELEALASLGRGEAAALLGKGSSPEWVRVELSAAPPRPDRYAAAWERSRPWWGAPVPAGPSRPRANDAPDDPGRELLLVLWAGLLADPAGPTTCVRLDDLRTVLGIPDEMVRTVGQRLAGGGGLRAFDGPDGRRWEVRREAIANLLPDGVDPEELTRADERWARIADRARERNTD